MTKIYVIRHAEAEGNIYRRFHGQYESGVTANGRRQIEALSRRFRDIPVDACYTSDLIRTQITAGAVYRQKNLPLQLEPAFREIYVGRWENVSFGWLYTYELEDMMRFDSAPEDWWVEGGETFQTSTDRFLHALNKVAEKHDGQTVCVFTHAAIIRCVMRRLFPGAKIGHSDNTAVTLLEYEAGSFRPVYFNDNSHLTEEISTLAKQTWWRENEAERVLDRNLWFREEAPDGEEVRFTAFFEQTPMGKLWIRDVDDDTGEVVYMELDPVFRGGGLAVQLLGQAVFHFRDAGKTKLLIRAAEESQPVQSLCKSQGMCLREDGYFELDLRLRP